MRERRTIDDVLSGRAAAARRWFEVPVLGAALLVIPVVFIEEYSTTGWLLTVAGIANCRTAVSNILQGPETVWSRLVGRRSRG